MKKTICMVMVVFTAGLGLLGAQDRRVDFSGVWTLNEEKSTMAEGPGGGRGRFTPYRLNITQKNDTLSVQATTRDRDGEEIVRTSIYNLDGTDSKNASGYAERISQIEWSKDGSSMTVFSQVNMSRGGREFSMDTEETWSIQDGMLVVESIRSTPRGEMKSKAVYQSSEDK